MRLIYLKVWLELDLMQKTWVSCYERYKISSQTFRYYTIIAYLNWNVFYDHDSPVNKYSTGYLQLTHIFHHHHQNWPICSWW